MYTQHLVGHEHSGQTSQVVYQETMINLTIEALWMWRENPQKWAIGG